MITVGTQLTAERVFDLQTIVILVLGLLAFCCGTIGGILFARVMNIFLKEKINPLIGSAGVSAVPMAARISHQIGQEENSDSFLLPHAMGPNVAGVIVTGVCTATRFSGDGAGLSGVGGDMDITSCLFV